MATLAQAIDLLRPEFPARDRLRQALITLIDDGNSYLSTVSGVVTRMIRKMVANLRQGNLRVRMQQIREQYQEFQDKYRDESKETEWHRLHKIIACSYDKLLRDNPNFGPKKANLVRIKMINGKIYTNANARSLINYSYTGSGFIYPAINGYVHADIETQGCRLYKENIKIINVLPCGLALISVYCDAGWEQHLRDFVTGSSVQVQSLKYPQNIIINDFGEYVPIWDKEFICMKLFGDLGPDFTIIALV